MRTDDGSRGRATERMRVEVSGLVQGVGFRPFVYRLATELGLGGWVVNDARGVVIEIEGPSSALDRFRVRLETEAPPRARIDATSVATHAPSGETLFAIRESDEAGTRSVPVLPDAAPCAACLDEVRDPWNRRHGYPFTNCTHCGPRFTIVRALPYDRPNTTMAGFAMCEACRREYEDPADRRFHAQPLACPSCGPRVRVWNAVGEEAAPSGSPIEMAATAVGEGRIVALKGLGGFQLLVDARDEAAVRRLRERKHRFEKPFAVMVSDVAAARALCEVSEEEARVLAGPATPIVLLRRRPVCEVAPSVAPLNPRLGLMLPSTPLHHLLLDELGYPVVCTSGNLSDEPICIDEREAVGRLGAIADLFLVHDRPIARHADDSVVWVVGGDRRLIRRARGFAPAPIRHRTPLPSVLALGAHQKNTVALAVGERVFVSQHVGDLDTAESLEAFERVIDDFTRIWEARPVALAHDMHPDYASTHWAERAGMRRVAVQHHHAHLAACLADNGAEGPALGVIWDGTGYGTDGTIWGGEFLLGSADGYRRIGHLRTFGLPGGDAAVREPRRAALALLWEMYGDRALDRSAAAPVASLGPAAAHALVVMLAKRVAAPRTSSMGRLFDAVASLAGLRQVTRFEGQAAMELEWVAAPGEDAAYPFVVRDGDPLVVDWAPVVEAILEDLRSGAGAGAIAARFHRGLVGAAVEVARRAGVRRVALAGGCFQNALLTEGLSRRLTDEGFEVLLHRQVPPNDGSVSLGQVAVAAARLAGVA